MGWSKRESPYERRIRELDEEAERVRKNMQQLMKGVSAGAASSRSSSLSTPSRDATSAPRGPRLRSSVDMRTRGSTEPDMSGDELPLEPAMADEKPSPSNLGASRTAARKTTSPEQFASYLASGSFGTPRSLSRERKLQRNKAIMMLVFALLAVYSLYVWMK